MRLKFVFPGILLLLVICDPSLAYAGTSAPIDGGVSLLIAAGIGYGIKKVRDERKRKKDDKELTK